MTGEIPQRLLDIPVDRTVESGMHYVVLGRADGGTLGFRVRSADKYDGIAVRSISKAFLLRAIRKCKEDTDYEVVWKAKHFRDWLIRYSEHCRQNNTSVADTPATESVKISWFSLVGVQAKVFTDRMFPRQRLRNK